MCQNIHQKIHHEIRHKIRQKIQKKKIIKNIRYQSNPIPTWGKRSPFASGQLRFLEAPLVQQADSELKKASLFLFSIEFELGKFFGNATYRYVINVLESHMKAHSAGRRALLKPIHLNLNNFTQFLLTTCTDLYRLLQSQQKVVCAHLNWTGFPVYT